MERSTRTCSRLLLIVVTLAKVGIPLAVVAFGLIASAVCALSARLRAVLRCQLDWMFWSWFKAFIQYSFIPSWRSRS